MDRKQTAIPLTRRDFLRGVGLALSTMFLEACGRRAALRPTATPPPSPSATKPPSPTATKLPSPTATELPSPTATLSPTATPLPPELAADLVLANGKVITVDLADTIAQAVAVKDGLIQAVGDAEAIRALVGEKTKVIDLGGKAVTPGLIDPHNHLQVLGQLQDFYVPFMPPEVTNLDDMRAKLAEAVAQKPEGEWVMGYFLVVGERLPNRHDLDPVSPNHPVWLLQQGGHYGSCNTKALEVAGITAATPSPEGGLIEKDASGQPTGVFYNHRAMDVLRRVAPVRRQR